MTCSTSAGDTVNQEHGSLYSLEELDRTMVETLEAGGGAFDANPLHTAAEVYINYRAENGPEEHKWRLFGEVNDWLAENGLSENTVGEYVEQLEEANPSYPLMNWRNTANLGDAAADHPAELVSLFEELYEGTDPIATRIDQFRSGLRSLIGETVTSDGIGFLFAAYDVDGYAPYKDGVFRDFIDYFTTPSQPELGSVGEKYAVFIECCETLADFLVNEGYLDEATPLDAQDFIYTIVEYEDQRYQFVLTYLWRYARRLDSMESTDDLLSVLQGLPEPFLRDQATQYESAEKVNRVRYEVLSQIINAESINYERIKATEDDHHEEDIFRPWSDFAILIQPYYNFARKRIERYLGDLVAYLRTELDAEDLTDRIVTFQGQANFPQTVTGLGLHPSDRNHTESYQLWVDITPTRIWFGLYAGSDLDVSDQMYDIQEISDESNLTLDAIIDHLQSVQPEFEELNQLDIDPPPLVKLSRFPNIAQQLQRAKQVVFYGPPGTGKTYHAVNFANWWIAEDDGDTDEQVQTVTFHPSFTYEDFLEGLTATAENGEVEYRIDDGVFKEFCNRARTAFEQADGSPPKYILVVDEINRGNLANVFGETITLIESDKRLGGDSAMETTLAHSGDDFGIPPNLYLLGTMNTADRSIALVDAALRRRFRFLSFPPEYDVLYEAFNFEDEIGAQEAAAESSGGVSELQALSVLGLQEINRRIIEATSLDRGKQLGHSYLMGQDSEAGIVDAWRYEILPLLEEYYFGQFERLRSQLLEETSDQLFDWERQQVQEFSADDLREALRSLLDIEVE
jgi:5-methylcytosine-specific restriction protein B